MTRKRKNSPWDGNNYIMGAAFIALLSLLTISIIPLGKFDINLGISDEQNPLIILSHETNGNGVYVKILCYDNMACNQDSYRMLILEERASECPNIYGLYSIMNEMTLKEHSWICGAAKDKYDNIGYSVPLEVIP